MSTRLRKDTKEHLILTESFPLPLAEYGDVLVPKMMAATRIWNACVWEGRETKKTEDRWPGEAQLKAKLKTSAVWKELAAQSAQAVVKEYFEAVRAYRTHRANGHTEAESADSHLEERGNQPPGWYTDAQVPAGLGTFVHLDRPAWLVSNYAVIKVLVKPGANNSLRPHLVELHGVSLERLYLQVQCFGPR